ncbi:MAG: hypothetical protein ACR2JN_03605, partial [Lapillicoccus sp.]
HQMVEDELASFIKWTVLIEGAGVVGSFVTFGAAEVPAQAAEAAEVANLATRVIRILQKLIELARLVATKIGSLLKKVTEIAGKLKKILGAKVEKALAKVGRSMRPLKPAAKRPSVEDPKLNNYVDQVYKGVENPQRVGDGTTMDAIREELRTGRPVHGKGHIRKGEELVRGLTKWLQKNAGAAAQDRRTAERLVEELKNALEGR